MPLDKTFNAYEKQRILDLRSYGQSIRDISKIINRSNTVAFQFIMNVENYGGTLKRWCKPKISNRTKRRIAKTSRIEWAINKVGWNEQWNNILFLMKTNGTWMAQMVMPIISMIWRSKIWFSLKDNLEVEVS